MQRLRDRYERDVVLLFYPLLNAILPDTQTIPHWFSCLEISSLLCLSKQKNTDTPTHGHKYIQTHTRIFEN